jgi:hypothetical protein
MRRTPDSSPPVVKRASRTVEHLVGLVFIVILMAIAWASFTVTAPFFAHSPISDWLRYPVGFILGFVNSLTVCALGIDLMNNGLKRWEFHRSPILAVWLLSVVACGVACITDHLLSARHPPRGQQQLVVAVAGGGVWMVAMRVLTRRAEAKIAKILAADRQNSD